MISKSVSLQDIIEQEETPGREKENGKYGGTTGAFLFISTFYHQGFVVHFYWGEEKKKRNQDIAFMNELSILPAKQLMSNNFVVMHC